MKQSSCLGSKFIQAKQLKIATCAMMLKGANAEVTIEQFDVDAKDIAILKPVTVHEGVINAQPQSG